MSRARGYRVRISPNAERDLESIVDYLSEHVGKPDAFEFVDALVAHTAILTDFPFRGPVPQELQGSGDENIRQTLYRRNRILYDVTADTVDVILVADGRRDISALIADRLLRRDPAR